jgi:hypothetical protein
VILIYIFILKYNVNIIIFYIDASYYPYIKQSGFGVYCPSENYCYCSYLSTKIGGNTKAEYTAIEKTISIIKNLLMQFGKADSQFLIYSDCMGAVDMWNSPDHIQEKSSQIG